MLNREQTAALAAVQRGQNLFLTGAGGTGKSHTIRAIVDWGVTAGLRVAVTAMTGCAALLLGLGAKTLHSWAGIGLAREAPAVLADAVKRNKRAMTRWRNTHLLIIDEVSMMTPELLEKLDFVARRVRGRSALRFGGLQVVFAGDFCQLPPVVKGAGADISSNAATIAADGPRFVFESASWPTLVDCTVELVELRRQSDPVFQRVLTEARMGALTADSIKVLEERMNLPWQENEIRPTLLFTRNAEVARINQRNMEILEGERRTYEVETTVMDKPDLQVVSPDDPDVEAAIERMDNDAPYDAKLELCVGAQVMLITNMDQDRGLVNGSRGILTGYTLGGLPIVRFLGNTDPVIIDRATWWLPDYEGIGRTQIPLRVAYAVTIHRAQGATLDSALVDIGSSTFEFGQAYVALSRVRSLDGLYVWRFDPRKVRCHPAVAAFYRGLAATATPAATEPTEADTADPTPTEPWTTDGLRPAWRAIVDAYFATPAGARLTAQVRERAARHAVAPAPEDVFAALRICPDPAAIRVVILGQDPYPTAGYAHGLAFSVRPSVVTVPASLQNIYKELVTDLGLAAPPASGCLMPWAEQGVLLLNDSLTVNVGAPLSHAGLGWEDLTARFLAEVLRTADHVVVIVWGRQAQKKLNHALVKPHLGKHTVLEAPHPSPLSAHTGFFGSRPFSKTNAALRSHGQEEIRWTVL